MGNGEQLFNRGRPCGLPLLRRREQREESREAPYGTVIVVPSPVAATVNVPAPALGVYVYEAPQAGEPPGGGTGTDPMKGPALWFKPLTAAAVRSVKAVGNAPIWAV
jgi:hypothetical protein